MTEQEEQDVVALCSWAVSVSDEVFAQALRDGQPFAIQDCLMMKRLLPKVAFQDTIVLRQRNKDRMVVAIFRTRDEAKERAFLDQACKIEDSIDLLRWMFRFRLGSLVEAVVIEQGSAITMREVG
jgi:hypothetical protein